MASSRKYKTPQTRAAEKSNLPDWGLGDHKDYVKLNAGIVRDVEEAPRGLVKAWGRGGMQGERGVRQFDKQYKLLMERILDLAFDKKLTPEASEAVLHSCAAILDIEGPPHWDQDGHVEYIRTLREVLKPEGYWEDYPAGTGQDGEMDDDSW